MHTQAISIVSICGLDTRVVMCDVCTGLRGHAGKASPSSQIRSLIAHLSLNPVCAIYCATLGILFNFSIHMFPLMEIMDRWKRTGDVGSIPGWERSLEKEMATHSSILAWRIPWLEEPGRLQSMGVHNCPSQKWIKF